jgi:anaerobic magnesium-protoporphyrin IX monomethyl ester cyclase
MIVTLIRPSLCFSASSYSMPLAFPIGCAYLAAVLEEAGYPTNVIDALSEGMDSLSLTDDGRFRIQGLSNDEIIARIDPRTDILGVTIMFSQEWPHIRKLLKRLKKEFPNAVLVVGGEHATALSEYSLRDVPEIDFVVRGEGEATFLELVKATREGKPKSAITGVAYLENGNYIHSALSPRETDLKKMPWPAWDKFNLEPYFRPTFTMGISTGRNMAMMATRGCPYQCTFCSSPAMWTTRYVLRSPQDVVDEMESYVKRYGVTSIEFYDLTAIVKRTWILEFAEELYRRNLGIEWQLPSGTRSEALDEEVLRALKRAGLKFVVYAPESGSPTILKKIKKQVILSKMVASIQAAKRQNLIVKVNFVVGFPDETRSDLWKTLLFSWKLALLGVDDCNMSLFSPYPGSELFSRLQREGKIPALDNAYFENLMMQFDFRHSDTYCNHVKGKELATLRVLGMAIFYGLSYIRSIRKMIRLPRLFLTRGKHFKPTTLLEQRLLDLLARPQKMAKTS